MNIISQLVPLFTKKLTSGTPNFIPMTGSFNTTFIKEARFARWIESATPLFTATWGYQMSNDDVDWTTTPTAVGSYTSTTGWTYDSSTSPTSVTTDQRLYVRFGLFTANASGTKIEQALGRIQHEVRPAIGRTVAAAGVRVFSQGSDADQIFHPLTGPAKIEDVGEHRPTLNMEADSGLLALRPAFQLSDDLLTWDDGEGSGANTFGVFGSARTSTGTDYGTTFTSFAPTNRKRFVRWGVAAKNESGTINEAGLASLRIDYRRVT